RPRRRRSRPRFPAAIHWRRRSRRGGRPRPRWGRRAGRAGGARPAPPGWPRPPPPRGPAGPVAPGPRGHPPPPPPAGKRPGGAAGESGGGGGLPGSPAASARVGGTDKASLAGARAQGGFGGGWDRDAIESSYRQSPNPLVPNGGVSGPSLGPLVTELDPAPV